MKTNVLEKLFIAKYPEYEVYGKPLYEYFDLFKSGYELAKQDDGCPDCFCEDCDKNCLAKEIISKLLKSYKYITKYNEYMDLLLVKQAEKFLEENK